VRRRKGDFKEGAREKRYCGLLKGERAELDIIF